MGTKKIIIPMVIAAVVGVFVSIYSYNTVKANNLSESATESISSNNNSESSNALNSTSSATKSTTANGATSNTTALENSNNTIKSTTNSNTTKSNSPIKTISSNNVTSTSTKALSNTKTSSNSSVNSTSKTTTDNNQSSSDSTNSTSTKNSGTISYNVPSTMYQESTVLVENTTEKPISKAQLNEYLRSWILVGQTNSYGICDASGTLWEEPWLNKVSQETLYQAFIDANGEAALSLNITDSEFIKATQELDKLTMNDVPFTLPEAKSLILEMLEKDGYDTPSEVTKIVLVKGSPSIYEVYTKESGDNAFWFVLAYSGYAHGGGEWY